MKFNTIAAASLAAASTLALSSSALAQAAAPAAPAITHGQPIAGLCYLSVEGAIATSTVGKYVQSRLQQIEGQVNAELNAERTSIDNDAKALDGQRSTLDQNTYEQRAAALQVRANAFQRKAQLRQREMEVTQQKALERVGQEMDPLVRTAYQQKNCSVLLSRTAVMLANPAMDITTQVVTALNARITQFAFDREHLDQPQAAPPVQTVPAPATPPRKK
jgi:outer membrane protein